MTKTIPKPETAILGGNLEIPRMINGLWQLAGGHDEAVNISSAAEAMGPLLETRLSAFDMADHYGDAELVIGQFNTSNPNDKTMKAFTKWCPSENGVKTFANAEAAIDKARLRMKVERIDLLQYHIWDYTNDTYLHNMVHLRSLQTQGRIGLLGVTNTDSAHLELLLDSGFGIATNQVSCSVIDRRVVRGRMAKVCADRGVGILAYGTLLGGFLSEKWIGQPEPEMEGLNWSLRKYLRFIHAAGGWGKFQVVLKALEKVAEKHDVSVSAVATRWVLDIPGVKAVIVGCRLTAESRRYAERNLEAFSLKLDGEDRRVVEEAQEGLEDIQGDLGDEYRRPPFLTAAGDLSHHVGKSADVEKVDDMIKAGKRVEFRTGSKWEDIAGYCRALRYGDRIFISGTTAHPPPGLDLGVAAIGGSSARSQTVGVLEIIARAVKALGGQMRDVVRTRVMIRREADVEDISVAHGWVFHCEGTRPANTLTTAGLIGDEFLVEIEAEAVVGNGDALICL